MSRKGGGSGGRGKSGSNAGGQRMMHTKVRTARGRKSSSTRWLQRQLNDPYVQRARQEGYRSRAAYKLLEMNEQVPLIRPGSTVVDLGAAPGGWSQVAVQLSNGGKVVALDILPFDPIEGVAQIIMDFTDNDAPERLEAALGDKADIVVSDMAPPTTGHPPTDHLRIMALCEIALDFALDVLRPGGHFVAKVFQGGAEKDVLDLMKKNFKKVKHIKPPASRKDSSEMYVIALEYKG